MQATQRPIRVLSIIEADYVSGAAKNLIEFAEHNLKAAAGVEHAIAVYRRGNSAESMLSRAIRERRIPLFVIPENGRFDLSVGGRIKQLAAEWNADIVETNNVKSHFFLRSSGLWRDRKWIAHHHGFTAEDLKMKLYNQTTRWSLQAANKIVTVCLPFAEQLAGLGLDREKIVVKHNSVAPFRQPSNAEIEEARIRIGAPADSKLLLSIGRLSPEKGHTDLIDAFDKLKDERMFLAIAGDGPEHSRLVDQAKRLSLDQSVRFLGQVSDVRPLYAIADVVVIPSHSEGSPHVLLEAKSAGTVIVATTVGGIPEIVTHGESALLVEAHNPKKLSEAIRCALDDTDLRQKLATQARERAAEQFSHTNHWDRWLSIYRACVVE